MFRHCLRWVYPLLLAAATLGHAQQPASTTGVFQVRLLDPVAEPAALPVFARSAPFRPEGAPDAAARARLEKYFSILAGKLRAVPGLELVTARTPGVPGVPFEVSTRLGADWQGVQVVATSVEGGPAVLWRTRGTPDGVLNLPSLTALWDDLPAEDAEREMESLVLRMRLELFPPDRALLEQKMTELRDPRLAPAQRRMALHQLITADRRRAATSRPAPAYWPDPALINAATDVAMTASDPEVRHAMWATLAGSVTPQINPAALLAPVREALESERELRIQLLLVNMLAMNLTMPQARAALDAVARGESDVDRPELVRMAARRVLNRGEGWSDYFVATLNDPQVPEARRLELISYVYSVAAIYHARLGEAGLRLNDADERALASWVKRGDSIAVSRAAVGVLSLAGGEITRAEFIDFLRTGTGRPLADNKVRRDVLAALARSLRFHPEIRPVFEGVAARDLDPAMREAARQALEQTKQGQQSRL